MKFLIVGRSGSGKDELKRHLESQYGWKFVKSYTTRPKRTPNEDTHIFISHEEAAKIPKEEKVAVTFIKNNTDTPDEYFATMQQVQEADAYIIDPKGVKMLLENMPKETFEIIYMQAQSEEKRKEWLVKDMKIKTKHYESLKNDVNLKTNSLTLLKHL